MVDHVPLRGGGGGGETGHSVSVGAVEAVDDVTGSTATRGDGGYALGGSGWREKAKTFLATDRVFSELREFCHRCCRGVGIVVFCVDVHVGERSACVVVSALHLCVSCFIVSSSDITCECFVAVVQFTAALN